MEILSKITNDISCWFHVFLAIVVGVIVLSDPIEVVSVVLNRNDYLYPDQHYSLSLDQHDVPKGYGIGFDTEVVAAIVSNPKRYSREFDSIVREINISIIDFMSNRLDVSDQSTKKFTQEYISLHHSYYVNLYRSEIEKELSRADALHETWYESGDEYIVDIFERCISKHSCFLISNILLDKTQNGDMVRLRNNNKHPCYILTNSYIRPLISKMMEQAFINDFSRSKGLFQEKVENLRFSILLSEIRDKKSIRKQLETSVWGINVSSSEIEISAISILQVGLQLEDIGDVEIIEKNDSIIMTFPGLSIISHEVYPKNEKVEIGWLREIDAVHFNTSVNSLREYFRNEALESGIMARTKENAKNELSALFTPFVKSKYPLSANNYKIIIKFSQ